MYLYPFSGLRAGDIGRFRSEAWACVFWMAYGAVQSLSRRAVVRGVCGWRLRVWQFHRARNGVERGRGGGLVCGGGGLWSAAEGRLQAPWSSGRDRREGCVKTASAAWAGTAQRSERGTDGRAGYQGEREQALTFEIEAGGNYADAGAVYDQAAGLPRSGGTGLF